MKEKILCFIEAYRLSDRLNKHEMRKWTKNKIKYIVQNRQNKDCKTSEIEK